MASLMETPAKGEDQILKEHDIKLRFMSAFAHSSVLALKEIPHRMRASRASRLSTAVMSI